MLAWSFFICTCISQEILIGSSPFRWIHSFQYIFSICYFYEISQAVNWRVLSSEISIVTEIKDNEDKLVSGWSIFILVIYLKHGGKKTCKWKNYYPRSRKKIIIIKIQNEIYVSFRCSWISNINLLFSYGNKLLLRITCTHDDKSIKFTERIC